MVGGFILLLIVVGLLATVVVILVWVIYRQKQRISALALSLDQLRSRKQSIVTRFGQITEQFIPFLTVFPFDPKSFRFLGDPVDGIAFEPDKIVFCEFKSSQSRLTPKQKHYRDLVNQHKVEWKEIRLDVE